MHTEYSSGTLALATGPYHVCARNWSQGLRLGGISCWGWNEFGQTHVDFPDVKGGIVLQISSGTRHSCAIVTAEPVSVCSGGQYNGWQCASIPAGLFPVAGPAACVQVSPQNPCECLPRDGASRLCSSDSFVNIARRRAPHDALALRQHPSFQSRGMPRWPQDGRMMATSCVLRQIVGGRWQSLSRCLDMRVPSREIGTDLRASGFSWRRPMANGSRTSRC